MPARLVLTCRPTTECDRSSLPLSRGSPGSEHGKQPKSPTCRRRLTFCDLTVLRVRFPIVVARNISREEPPKSLHTTAASNVGSMASCRDRRHPKATLLTPKPTLTHVLRPEGQLTCKPVRRQTAVRRGQSECYAQPQAVQRGARCQPVHRSGLAVTYGHVRYLLASKTCDRGLTKEPKLLTHTS